MFVILKLFLHKTYLIMSKRLDAIIAKNLIEGVQKINSLNVPREDVVTIFQNSLGKYVILFYMKYDK